MGLEKEVGMREEEVRGVRERERGLEGSLEATGMGDGRVTSLETQRLWARSTAH